MSIPFCINIHNPSLSWSQHVRQKRSVLYDRERAPLSTGVRLLIRFSQTEAKVELCH